MKKFVLLVLVLVVFISTRAVPNGNAIGFWEESSHADILESAQDDLIEEENADDGNADMDEADEEEEEDAEEEDAEEEDAEEEDTEEEDTDEEDIEEDADEEDEEGKDADIYQMAPRDANETQQSAYNSTAEEGGASNSNQIAGNVIRPIETEMIQRPSTGAKDVDPNKYTELIYVALARDVMSLNSTQVITLDASNFEYGVFRAEAVFKLPDGGRRLVDMERVQGDKGWGTYSGSYTPLQPGKYNLTDVNIYSTDREPQSFPIKNRSFYVSNSTPQNMTNLSLVYVMVSNNMLARPGSVIISLDAADGEGIENVTGYIASNRGMDIEVEFHLSRGDNTYGTWSSQVMLDTPDTTYHLELIRLENNNTVSWYNTSQQVYVGGNFGEMQDTEEDITTMGWVKSKLASPLLPTFLAFLLMGVLSLLYTLTMKEGEDVGR